MEEPTSGPEPEAPAKAAKAATGEPVGPMESADPTEPGDPTEPRASREVGEPGAPGEAGEPGAPTGAGELAAAGPHEDSGAVSTAGDMLSGPVGQGGAADAEPGGQGQSDTAAEPDGHDRPDAAADPGGQGRPGTAADPGGQHRPDTTAEPEGPAVPQPIGVGVTPTGEGAVDAGLRRLADADHLPVSEHLQVYEDVHRGLRDVLAGLDQHPGPPAPSSTTHDNRS